MSQKTKCEYCDGSITKVKNDLPFKSKALGAIMVPGIEQFKCSKCGNSSISLDEANKVSQFVRNKEQHIIENLPACEFISLNQAAGLLGISKQAFSKHPRIKRGFIYSITIDNKVFFYKRSVEAFKESRDGRISLSYQSIIKQIDVEMSPNEQQEAAYIPMDVFGRLPNTEIGFKVFLSSRSNPLSVENDATDLIMPFIFQQQSNYISCRTTH